MTVIPRALSQFTEVHEGIPLHLADAVHHQQVNGTRLERRG